MTDPTAAEVKAMSNEELARYVRETGAERTWALDNRINHELSARLILGLVAFKNAADRSSRTLNRLTFVLVALTIVLVIYAIRAG